MSVRGGTARSPIAALVLVASLLSTAVTAADCPIEHAAYAQLGTHWELRFADVPIDGAANQTHAFLITDTGKQLDYTGAVYVPNGYGQPMGFVTRAGCEIERDAGVEDVARCTVWSGEFYIDTAEAGIAPIGRAAAAAPRQVLLAGFGEAWWYSDLRDPDNVPLDVFTLEGGAP